MTTYVLRLSRPTKHDSFADVATTIALASEAMRGESKPGPYLVSSDPDADDGRGHEVWSNNIKEAKRFKSNIEAIECFRAQSTVRPYRPDGKPNRPMTAYSVIVEEIAGEPTIIGAG